jgi:hypothetical protein
MNIPETEITVSRAPVGQGRRNCFSFPEEFFREVNKKKEKHVTDKKQSAALIPIQKAMLSKRSRESLKAVSLPNT